MNDDNDKRTAMDVLLNVEKLLQENIASSKTQELATKILSNKINYLIEVLIQTSTTTKQNFSSSVKKVEDIAEIPLNSLYPKMPQQQQAASQSEDNIDLFIDASPVGFRRTSKPETYHQPNEIEKNTPTPSKVPYAVEQDIPQPGQRVPVIQRVVDKNGKAVFMADVEVINVATKKVETKTRTNGMGKWQASLPVGHYKVVLKKQASAGKDKIEVVQDLSLDGSTPSKELQMLLIK